jgi:hypothetical protein
MTVQVTKTPRPMYVHTKNIFDDASWSDPVYVEQSVRLY